MISPSVQAARGASLLVVSWASRMNRAARLLAGCPGVSAASSLLSSMFAIYKDAVLAPRAVLPPGVPPVEGSREETEETVSHRGSCCRAVGLWRSIRQTAERNDWPFYVSLQDGEPMQLALASSVAPKRGGPGDPTQAFGSPRPLLDFLSARASQPLSSPLSPQGSLIKTLRNAVPLAAPGSVSAALTVAAVETQALLGAAENEGEQDKILKALESCSVRPSMCCYCCCC